MTPSDDASTPHDEAANKPWGGRFETPTNAFVEAFTASVEFDRRLYAHDIQGSIAHATMLAATGVLTAAERDHDRSPNPHVTFNRGASRGRSSGLAANSSPRMRTASQTSTNRR